MFYFIRFLLTSMLFYSIVSCNMVTNKTYIGEYQIDLSNSRLGKYQYVDSVFDLKLSIRNDRTFRFSKDVVFVYAQTGKWEVRRFSGIDIPVSYRCYFKFEGMLREDVLLPMDDKCDRVYFNLPMSKTDQKDQVELLVFKRVK